MGCRGAIEVPRRRLRLFALHQELFGETLRSRWLTVDDGLRREIADRLAVLGYHRLEDWAGAANFEGEDRIDPVVLDVLRRGSN